MDEELSIINSDLSDVLSKLLKSNANCKDDDLQQKRLKVATLIRLHVRHLQQTVVVQRRRRQQQARRRLKNLRTFFMQQMMQLQSNYVQMFVMLRMKYNQLQIAEEMETELEMELENRKSAVVEEKTLFWEHKVPKYSDEEFLDIFHVTRSTFQSLCGQLAPTLRSVPELKSQSEFDILPDKCVGLALFFLASGERISIISEQFALPRASTIKCLKVFCNAVMTSLGKALRLLPQSEADCANVVAGFRRECNMPPALLGVLGVCSIPLRGKGKHKEPTSALRMQFLLDDRMLFRELRLDNSNGGKAPLPPMFAMVPNALTQSPPRRINQRSVPAFVLAPPNQNYPLRPWLLQRYAEPTAPHEYDFNEVADHLQEMSDSAMHRLMSRWRFLSQPLDISFQTASCIITAATVLHNLLEELREPYIPEWGDSVDVSRFRSPPIESKADNSAPAELARDLRDFLARTISSTEM